MSTILKALLLTILLHSGQAALATPKDDALYIVQRNLGATEVAKIRRLLKQSFVPVYFKPLSALGIKLGDGERFTDLIPDEDVEPFLEHFLLQNVEIFVSNYRPDQLAWMASLLRADEDSSLEEILSEKYQTKAIAALEQARAKATPSGAGDPLVIGLEELVLQLDAFNTMFDDVGIEEFSQDFAASMGSLFLLINYGHEIAEHKRELDNPVTIAVIEADGILKFSNRVQRQNLLRQLSASEHKGGIRFIKPPASKNTVAN